MQSIEYNFTTFKNEQFSIEYSNLVDLEFVELFSYYDIKYNSPIKRYFFIISKNDFKNLKFDEKNINIRYMEFGDMIFFFLNNILSINSKRDNVINIDEFNEKYLDLFKNIIIVQYTKSKEYIENLRNFQISHITDYNGNEELYAKDLECFKNKIKDNAPLTLTNMYRIYKFYGGMNLAVKVYCVGFNTRFWEHDINVALSKKFIDLETLMNNSDIFEIKVDTSVETRNKYNTRIVEIIKEFLA